VTAVSPHHLVVLPLPCSVSVTEALAAIGRLERATSLEVLDAVVVEARGQDRWCGADITIGGRRERHRRVEVAPRRDPRPSWAPRGAEPVKGPVGGTGVSESFVAEVGELLATPGQALVFIVSGLDRGAAVSELQGPRGRGSSTACCRNG
jgi:hypothetical protein